MVKKNGAASSRFTMTGFSEGVQDLKSREANNLGINLAREALRESERPKEHFEEAESLSRAALMDCYNG